MRYVSRLIESAQSEIVLIDPYSDAVTLEVLSKKRSGVKVRLNLCARPLSSVRKYGKISLFFGEW